MSDFDRVLARYEERAAREERRMATMSFEELAGSVDQFLLGVGPVVGSFLADLARGLGARRILELGTSHGYSTLWLARAAKDCGARVVSVDVAAAKQAYAAEQLRDAGLDDVVELRTSDAIEVIAGLDGVFDLVLLDIWKDLYIACFDAARAKMAPGGILVADNMLEPAAHRETAQRYRDHIRALPGIQSVLLPLGQGLEVTRFGA